MNRFLQKFVGEPSDASWASARVEEETGASASSFFAQKQQPPMAPPAPQPQNDVPLTSTTGGVYDTVDLFEDSSAKGFGHSQQHQQGYMLHGHGQRLHEEVLAEPQYDPPTTLFPSPRNGFGDPFAKAAASSLFSYEQRQPSPRRTAADMFGPSSEPAMTFPPPPQQQQQAASDPFGPSSAPGSSFPSRAPQQEEQSHYQQQQQPDPIAAHSHASSGLSFPPQQQSSFHAADPFAASSGLSFPSQPPQQDPFYSAPSHEPVPASQSSSDVPANDFFSSAPTSASSLFSSGPSAAPTAADLFAATPANQLDQQDWTKQSVTEVAASATPVPEAPRQEAAPVYQEQTAPVENAVPANPPAPQEQTPHYEVTAQVALVQPPQMASELNHVQPPRSQDRAYTGYSLPPRSQSSMPPRSQSSQPPRSQKSALDDQIRLVEMYKQMAERLEGEKNDLLKVLADQSDQFYRMQDYITSLEQELAAYRPPQ